MQKPWKPWTKPLALAWMLFGAALLLSARPSYAQVPGLVEPVHHAVPLEKGEPAPFSGQLITPDLAADLAVGLERCEKRQELELKHAEMQCKLRVKGAQAVQDSQLRAANAKIKVLQAALEEARKQRERPFWEEPFFVAPVAVGATVVVTTAVVFGSVWAVGQLRPAIPAP